MTSAKYLLSFVVFTSSLFAQHFSHPVMVSRDDAFSSPRSLRVAADTIDLLAVMVQFQVDSDSRTNGNGQFDLSTPATTGLDAPPHNKQFFQDHLTFLTNYYRKVSKGKTIIRATLVDTVYTLSSQMQRYSPPKNGPNTVVGDLARDAWQKVDSSGTVQDFSQYEAFVLFHAGVGRDVDVASTIGFDPTPLDIPSLYLGLNAFKGFYGADYQGIPVRGGFRIANTIIMPETETRELPATPTNVTLRLGINGLLCSSVGNYLGLPDLFDTNTGRSGIGRFGLMDGQAIFSFAGAFPPEPSAWEKYWLGWIQPIVVSPKDTTTKFLPAVSMNDMLNRIDTVYRVPISSSEYYLVENRNRDWAQNGQRVTTSYSGIIRQQTYARDTTGFESFDVAAISGNVLDVDDFDWSLPGGVGRNGTFFDGGILIWHIDETAIAQGLRTNGVNGNPNRRGVDVEEADGSQDIGQSYGQLEAGSGSEEGTALDFWYQGNESPVNNNEFSATSYPSSASNNSANSHITIKNFSTRGSRMTAKIVVGDDIALLSGFPKQVAQKLSNPSLTVASIGTPASVSIMVATTRDAPARPTRSPFAAQALSGEMYAWKTDGSPVLRSELFARSGGPIPSLGAPYVGSPAITDFNSAGPADVIIADANSTSGILHVYQSSPNAVDSLALEIFARTLGRRPTTSPLVTDSIIVVGAARATVYRIIRLGGMVDSLSIPGDTSDVVGIANVGNPHGFVFTTASGRIGSNLTFISSSSQSSINLDAVGPPVIGRLRENNPLVLIYATRNGSVHAYSIEAGFNQLRGFPVNTGATISVSSALADIDGDGNRDIIVFAGNKIYAYNYAGASLDNFPKPVPSSNPITSNPVVADVDGDGLVDIVAVTGDGLVVAYNKNGKMAKGFPLQAGTGNQSVAAFEIPTPQLSTTDIGLAVASSDDGSVTAWKTGRVGGNRAPNLPWSQYQHDAQHTGLAIEPITGASLSSSFFPKERAYNWPNPAYEGKTFIRYFVSENAIVKITVFDLAGDRVTEFNGPGVAGVDNEVEWNVRDVQSGVYLARIEATSGGKNETAIVKVAVVK